MDTSVWYIIVGVFAVVKLMLIICCIIARKNKREALAAQQQNVIPGRNIAVVVQPRYDQQQYTFGSRTPIMTHEEVPAWVYVPQLQGDVPQLQGAMSPPAYAQAVNNPSAPPQYGQMAPPPKYDAVMGNKMNNQ